MVQATAAQRRQGSQGNRTRARTSRWQVNRHKRHNHEEVGARLRLTGDSPAPTCARKGESLRLPFNANSHSYRYYCRGGGLRKYLVLPERRELQMNLDLNPLMPP